MKSEKIKELLKIVELSRSGYAGMLQNGNIVDRREHPEAVPIQENVLFGVAKPKPVNNEKI
jgi:sulfur carrier protein ThiS